MPMVEQSCNKIRSPKRDAPLQKKKRGVVVSRPKVRALFVMKRLSPFILPSLIGKLSHFALRVDKYLHFNLIFTQHLYHHQSHTGVGNRGYIFISILV